MIRSPEEIIIELATEPDCFSPADKGILKVSEHAQQVLKEIQLRTGETMETLQAALHKAWKQSQAVQESAGKRQVKKPKKQPPEEPKEETPEPSEAVLSMLKNDFLESANKELDATIVREHDTRKTLLLVFIGGMKVTNAQSTSSNIMVNDESGAGKDFIVKAILKLFPKEKTIIRKRITEKVFSYWHNSKYEPDWTWNGKIFYNEDVSNSILNSDVFKVMASSDGENSSTIIINQVPVEIITKGKPVMVITIYAAAPKQELLRRFPIVNVDTSEEQTKLILQRKAQLAESGIKNTPNHLITEAITALKPVKVKVPFASLLVNVLSTRNIIIRTHFDRFLDYIKFATAINQYQRETDDDGFLLATPADYELARTALIKTTSNIFSVPLTKYQQKILDILKGLPSKIKEGTLGEIEDGYSVAELEQYVTFISDRTLRIELDKLTTLGFLKKTKAARDNSTRPVMVYAYLDDFRINVPTWQDVQNCADTSSHSFTSNDSTASLDSSYNLANEANEPNELKNQDTKINVAI